jgi:hypothetical protein
LSEEICFALGALPEVAFATTGDGTEWCQPRREAKT